MDIDDDVPASTPTKKAAPRRRQSKQPVLQPGKAKQPGSYINIDNPEATMAAYCGIDDVGVFRKFYRRALVIPYYIKTLGYKGYHRRTVLSLLEDLPYDQYWASDANPQDVYPLLRAIRNCLSAKTLALDKEEFRTITGCELPTPSTPLLADELPSFCPFAGETSNEAFNRCLCLFAHIKHTLSPSQWSKRFFGKTDWAAPRQITIDYQPEWMRSQESVEMEAPDEWGGPVSEMPITVRWNELSKNKKNMQYVKEMTEQETLSQIPKEVTIRILATMSPSEVRYRIREAFRLDEFDGQLLQLTLHQGERAFPALDADWVPIFTTLVDHPESTFTCVFRERVDGEITWEYGGPPAVLKTYVENQQGNVTAKYKLSEEQKQDVQSAIFKMTVHKMETSFDPLKMFGNDLARMKTAYDGIDVTKTQGMREWQLKHLPSLAGFEAVQYVQDVKLKAFRKLSKPQQAVLEAAQQEGAMQTVDMEPPDHDDDEKQLAHDRYYAYQTVIGGTSTCVGPPH